MVIPKTFSRPGVEIGTRVTRRWVRTCARNISAEDVVQDEGLVVRVSHGPKSTTVAFFSKAVIVFKNNDVIYAFTEGESVGLS